MDRISVLRSHLVYRQPPSFVSAQPDAAPPKAALNILIHSASHPVVYHLISMLASGSLLAAPHKIHVFLQDDGPSVAIPSTAAFTQTDQTEQDANARLERLEGLAMEIQDLASSTIEAVTILYDNASETEPPMALLASSGVRFDLVLNPNTASASSSEADDTLQSSSGMLRRADAIFRDCQSSLETFEGSLSLILFEC